ncbi:MAG: LytTR family DNA-binding domain-containing protein [Bacteroidota bacterium]
MIIRTLIVDDERLARDVLAAYAERCQGIEVVAKCRSASEARELLAEKAIDLMLLDIQMPRELGTDFLRGLADPPLVIFTTAFADYALSGYELNAVDYLLKPIGFERFQMAIEKIQQQIEMNSKALAFDNNRKVPNGEIIIKEGHNFRKIPLQDIRYVAAMREYVSYHTSTGKTLELRPLTQVENMLPAAHFLRVHRSYIVAKKLVRAHVGNKLLLETGEEVPMGKTFKKRALAELFRS